MQPLLTWFHNLPDPVAEWLTLLEIGRAHV